MSENSLTEPREESAPPPPPPRRARTRSRSAQSDALLATLKVFVTVGLCYAAGAALSWRLFGADEIGLAFFPPAGVTLAAMVLVPRRRWWAIIAAIVVAEIAVDLGNGSNWAIAVGYGTANVLQPLVGASLLLRLSRGRVELHRRRGMAQFLIAGVVVGAAAGGLVGGLTKAYNSDVSWVQATLYWWAGDGLGVLVIATPILSWHAATRPHGRRLIDASAALAVVAVASVAAFWTSELPPAVLVVPVLVWVALRFATPGVALAGAVMAMIANVATAAGIGPFAALPIAPQSQLGATQLFIASVVISAWFVAIEGSERVEASVQRELERAARERAESAKAFGELSSVLLQRTKVDEVAQTTAAHVALRFSASLVLIGLYDAEADRFKGFPSTLPDPVRTTVAGWNRSTIAPGPVAMNGDAPVWVTSAAELAERFPVVGSNAKVLHLGALAAWPLRIAGATRGYLLVARDRDEPFSTDERNQLEAVAAVVGTAVERAGLYEAERAARLEAQLLADQAPLPIWVHDANGEQEWVNQTFCEFFGINREDLHTDRWQVLMHPDDASSYLSAFQRSVARRQPFHSQVRVRRADGQWRWLESWGQPRFDPAGTFLGHVGSSADVTDRLQAEADLAAAHAFTQELTALVPGVISVFDLDQQRTVFTSRQLPASGVDQTDEGAAGHTIFVGAELHPDDSAAVDADLLASRHLHDDELITVEYRTRHDGGSWRWMQTTSVPIRRNIDGSVAQIANLAIDITDHKTHEAELNATAVLETYGARLADALRELHDTDTIDATAIEMLSEHLHGAEVAVVAIEDSDQHSQRGTTGSTNRPPGRHRLVDYGVAVRDAVAAGDTVLVDDVATDVRLQVAARAVIVALGIGAAALQPIGDHDPRRRVLVVTRAGKCPWPSHEVTAIAVTAERICHALQLAHSELEKLHQHSRAALAAQLLADMDTAASLEECAQQVVDSLVPDYADYATVEQAAPANALLAVKHSDPVKMAALHELRRERRLDCVITQSADRAAQLREPQLLPVIEPEMLTELTTDPETAARLTELSPRSHITVPVDLGGGHRGNLLVGLSDSDRAPFTVSDLTFFADLGHRIGLVFATRHLREAERHIAVTLQKALLPDIVRWDPSALVEARYRAASDFLQVGGDWYDTFTWPDGSIGIMVGDVVGHSLESAAAMGRLRAAASALAAAGRPSPSYLLQALDRFARSSDGTDFATAACVVLQPETGLLTYASAGHPPVLIIAPDGAVMHLDGALSPPLSTGVPPARPETTITLEPGSLVVLYSDGLIERRGESIDVGLGRLTAALVERLDQPTAAILDGVINELTGVSPAGDDIVVAAFRYCPAIARLHLEVPSNTAELARARQQIREWLTDRHIDHDTSQAMLIAIGEACTNIIDHAYIHRPSRPNTNAPTVVGPAMIIDLADHHDDLIARVSDQGCWRQPGAHSRERGRGTLVMQGLTHRYERETKDTGTTVSLAVRATARLQPVHR